jgi:hypothetical protein
MKDADHRSAGDQRSTHQRSDALGKQDRVDHLRVVYLIEDHRSTLSRDPPGKASSDVDPDPLLNLLLKSARGRRDQLTGRMIEQQDRRSVGLQGFANALDEDIEQRLGVKPGERAVCNGLDAPELLLEVGQHASMSRRRPRGMVIILRRRNPVIGAALVLKQ